jgi:hypothetical protein
VVTSPVLTKKLFNGSILVRTLNAEFNEGTVMGEFVVICEHTDGRDGLMISHSPLR